MLWSKESSRSDFSPAAVSVPISRISIDDRVEVGIGKRAAFAFPEKFTRRGTTASGLARVLAQQFLANRPQLWAGRRTAAVSSLRFRAHQHFRLLTRWQTARHLAFASNQRCGAHSRYGVRRTCGAAAEWLTRGAYRCKEVINARLPHHSDHIVLDRMRVFRLQVLRHPLIPTIYKGESSSSRSPRF